MGPCYKYREPSDIIKEAKVIKENFYKKEDGKDNLLPTCAFVTFRYKETRDAFLRKFSKPSIWKRLSCCKQESKNTEKT